jgi:serine/threonine protein phosphatase PrpC
MGCLQSKQVIDTDSNALLWRTPNEFLPNFPDNSTGTAELLPAQSIELLVGTSHTKGGRPYMEDIDVVFDGISVKPNDVVSLCGIFDGHGGKDCAAYVAKYLPVRIFNSLRSPAKGAAEVIYRAFIEVDSEWVSVATNDAGKIREAGSTATVFLWKPIDGRGYMANVGDTRAVLCRGGLAVDMTKDHKATDPEVVEAVNARGGFVANNRINGILGTLLDLHSNILFAFKMPW